ncbi:hypothetical protein B0H19DRAFT_1117103 [Mycena capillaripes]|nr:hypothetical protein B0H19DRAFT_1117103 [Mycena capillaripes]
MYFTFLLKALGVALLCSISTRADDSHHSSVHSDIQCPKGSHASFIHNSYTYNAPLHKFTDLTKSFFNITWYDGIVVTNTTGTDNVPGATRSGPFGGTTYNETLTTYSMRSDALTFSFHGKGFTDVGPPSVTFDSYVETFRFESICSGKATYIDVLTHVCSNDQTVSYNLWYALHMTTFEGMAAGLGALILAGDCPVESKCHNE